MDESWMIFNRPVRLVAVVSLLLTVSFFGCRATGGPWSRPAYEVPTPGGKLNQTIITPGSPMPNPFAGQAGGGSGAR